MEKLTGNAQGKKACPLSTVNQNENDLIFLDIARYLLEVRKILDRLAVDLQNDIAATKSCLVSGTSGRN